MKKFLAAIAILLIFANQANATKNPKDVKSVKTFDFEKVLRETEGYFNAAARWKKIKCMPKTSFVCTKRECPEIKFNDSYFVIDKDKETLSICRNQMCKMFKAEITASGVFHSINIEDSNGILIKVLGDNRYKEITMLGLDAYISNGECEDYDEEKEKKIAQERKSKKKKYRLNKGK